jgi:hypothetical protein
LLLFASFGYSINRSTGDVIQNGLVFVDSHPEQAQIVLNGQDKGTTDGRYVLEAGKYDLELSREGYRPWKRSFNLEGGNIVRLVYPFLFPDDLTGRDLLAYSVQPDMVSSSPDRRWVVSHSQDAFGNLLITDTSVTTLPTSTITLPPALFESRTGAQSFELEEWSTDNRHFLVKYSFDGGYDYLVLDRERPQDSFSVSQVFGKAFSKVAFRDKAFDQLYLYEANGGVLQAGRVSDRFVEPVAIGVESFWPYKSDTLLYTSHQDVAPDKAAVWLKKGSNTYKLREVARSSRYMLNLAEFDGAMYVIAGSIADGKVYIYKDPLSKLKDNPNVLLNQSVLLRLEGAQYLSFSNNARFIALQNGSRFNIYDLETKQQYKYDTGIAVAQDYEANWMDGHRLLMVAGSKAWAFDYDGINKQELVTAHDNFMPLFDRDYNQMFTVSPTTADKSKLGLVWTDLNLGIE